MPDGARDELAALRAANARLREVIEAKDIEIAALRSSHQAQLDALRAQVAALATEVGELRARVGRNSRNSSKPPSSEGLAKPVPRSLRKKSGRGPGRPKGQPGATLEMTGRPDAVQTHEPGRCAGCGAVLPGAPVTKVERRQVTDLPEDIRARVTEHRIISRRCLCGTVTAGVAPAGVSAPVQYGPRIAAVCAYLWHGQFLSRGRTCEAMAELFGVPVSPGAAAGMVTRVAGALSASLEAIRAAITAAAVAHFDETGFRVGGALAWVHSASSGKYALITVHPKRGREAMDAAGVLPAFGGIAVHDAWAPYDGYDRVAGHALCNAHSLRELQAVMDAAPPGQWCWAAQAADAQRSMKRLADASLVIDATLDHLDQGAATVLLPDFPVPDLRDQLARLGFTRFRVLPSGQLVQHGGLRLMAQALASPADGPLGDSLLAVDDGTAAVLNQNDARPVDLTPVLAFGPFDVHFLQYSGAIWWPWTYELPPAAKRANGLDRAARYARAVGARHIVPSAGPACFLDDELFHLNDVACDDANTFPDQTVFLHYLAQRGLGNGMLLVPGAVLELDSGSCRVHWPAERAEALRPFTDKAAYLRSYADRMRPRIEAGKRQWPAPEVDILAELKRWFEPLLELAGHIRAGVGGPVLLRIVGEDPLVIDFPAGQVRGYRGEACRYQFTVDGRLISRLIAGHQVDWVNSLFLSMRFRARRIGPYNEYLYTFFKCLAPDRLMYAEGWYASQQGDEDDIQLGDWVVQRRCPHLHGDLSRFGTTDGSTLTRAMHGWQFDLATGRCLASDAPAHRLRSRPASSPAAAAS